MSNIAESSPLRAQRSAFGLAAAGLILPYVLFEPAPIDIILPTFLLLQLLWGSYKLSAGSIIFALVYVFSTAISSVNGAASVYFDPLIFYRYLLIEGLLVVTTLLLFNYMSKNRVRGDVFIKYLIIGSIVSCVIIVAFQLLPLPRDWIYASVNNPRIKGTFKDPNVLGPFLIFPIVALIVARDKIFRSPFWLLGIPLLAFTLYQTYSRGAYGAALIAISLAVIARIVVDRNIRPLGYVAISVFASVLLLSILISLNLITLDVQFFRSRLALQGYDDTRFMLSRYAVTELGDHIFGMGPGIFGSKYHVNPHNLFLGKATDAGLVSAVMICAFLLWATFNAWSHYFRTKDLISLALGATLVSHLIESNVIYSHHWRHMLFLAAVALARPLQQSAQRRLPLGNNNRVAHRLRSARHSSAALSRR